MRNTEFNDNVDHKLPSQHHASHMEEGMSKVQPYAPHSQERALPSTGKFHCQNDHLNIFVSYYQQNGSRVGDFLTSSGKFQLFLRSITILQRV